MFKHCWSILCTDASISEGDQELNLNGVVQQVVVNVSTPLPEGSPVSINLPFKKRVISMWLREEASEGASTKTAASLQMKIERPDGSFVEEESGSIYELEDVQWQRTTIEFLTFAVQQTGVYKIQIEIRSGDTGNWKLVTEIPVYVDIRITYNVVAESS